MENSCASCRMRIPVPLIARLLSDRHRVARFAGAQHRASRTSKLRNIIITITRWPKCGTLAWPGLWPPPRYPSHLPQGPFHTCAPEPILGEPSTSAATIWHWVFSSDDGGSHPSSALPRAGRLPIVLTSRPRRSRGASKGHTTHAVRGSPEVRGLLKSARDKCSAIWKSPRRNPRQPFTRREPTVNYRAVNAR